ncbi:MAG: ComEC/Rec2 family competence protein, partial [Alicyclobacillaceae bacterium]|nr:ComEC/Rec2 family competence protein [Alicyclobacillaceae bacterium]
MMARPGDLLLPSLGVWTAACAAVGASVPLTWQIPGFMAAVVCWGILVSLRLKHTWVSPAWIGGWRGWIRFLGGWPPTVFLVLGVTACFSAHRSAFPDSPGLDAWVGQRIRIEAEVTSVLLRSRDGETAVAEIITVWDDTGDGIPRSGGRTRVRIRLPEEVFEGDRLVARVRLRLPPVPPAPFPEGVRDPWDAAESFYRADLEDDSDLAVKPTWRSASRRIRAALERVWAGAVEQRASALLNAMVLGDETGLDPRVTDAFALTGVAHVVAVSGAHLHVLIWPLRKWLAGRMRPGKRMWVLGGTASLYAWITGGSPSAVRAAAMVWYAEAAGALGRSSRPLHAWGATLTAEVFMDPEWVFDLGFQLSYAATWGIFVLEPALRNALRPVPRWLRMPLAGSLAAEIATCPISFSAFYVWNGWTLLANIWVPAAGSAVLVCGLLSLLLAPVPLLGSWTTWVAGYVSGWVVRGVLAMDGDRRWLFELGPLPLWMWGLYGVGLLVCVGWKG